jgi:hypothetical protein
MSRHGSIFYDAPEALNALNINEEKDEMGKIVREKSSFEIIQFRFYFCSQIQNHQVMVMMKVMPVMLIVN